MTAGPQRQATEPRPNGVQDPPWEAFLTERDRVLLATAPPRRLSQPSRAVLLSVDNYRAAVGDEPADLLDSVPSWPSSTGLEGWAALDRVAELMTACRRLGVPVVHVVGVPEEQSGIPTWREGGGGRRGRTPVTEQDRERHARRYELVPQAAARPGEPMLGKSAPSAFFGTPLAPLLVSMGCHTVIVVGQSTSGCVRATVVDAASYRFSVVVPVECVYDRNQSSHAMNLFDMHDKYADVMCVDDVVRQLERLAAAAPG